MDPVPPIAALAQECSVLKNGGIVGPMSLAELRAGLADGRFAESDLVQHGNVPIWRRGSTLPAAEDVKVGAVQGWGWREISTAVVARLRDDVQSASLATAAVFLALGLAAWLLTHWPIFLWLPWFIPPVAAGVIALTRGDLRRGLLLLLTVAAVPALATTFRPKPALPTLPPEPAPPARAPAALPPSAPAPVALPAIAPQAAPLPVEIVPASVAKVAPIEPELPSVNVRHIPLPADKPAALKQLAPVAPGELVQRHRDAFLVVAGKEGNGSGFVCRLGGRPWILTNTHVAAGTQQPHFTQLNGTQVGVGAAEAAAGFDVMRLAPTAVPPNPLEAIVDLEKHAQIGDEVVVLGNTGGGGVVTSLEGKLLGIGPDRIEVSSEFIPGNSGSPIVHLKTGKVIGIATYLTRRYEEFSGPPRGANSGEVVVRRYGFRLDTVKKWEPVVWPVFQSEAAKLQKISQLTGDVFDFLAALREKREPEFATDTLRRPAMDWVTKVGRNTLSEADRRSATQGFLGALRLMVRADVVAAENGLRYSFFRDELARERGIRDRLYKSFDDEVKRMSSPAGRSGF